jgi:hypothetical protein
MDLFLDFTGVYHRLTVVWAETIVGLFFSLGVVGNRKQEIVLYLASFLNRQPEEAGMTGAGDDGSM